jgi:hypothetical protein
MRQQQEKFDQVHLSLQKILTSNDVWQRQNYHLIKRPKRPRQPPLPPPTKKTVRKKT